MSDVEDQVRHFVREGRVPVVAQPTMQQRVEQGMRRRRRTRATTAAIAGVAAVGGVFLAAAYAQRSDDGNSAQVAADPAASTPPASLDGRASDCSAVTVLAAATSTSEEASGTRGLAVVLSNGGPSDSSGPACMIGAGTEVELAIGQQTVSAEVSATADAVSLGASDDGGLQLAWSNWCESAVPQLTVTFTDGSTSQFSLPEETATPDCTRPAEPSVLTFERLEHSDVEDGGSRPAP